MATVRVSPKFQVVIPLEIRQALRLKPGQRLQVLRYENRIELIPVPDMKAMRGFVRGLETSVLRDEDRV